MFEAIITGLLWILNMGGFLLWALVFLLSIEAFGKYKFRTWTIWNDWKYWINWIYFISAFCVVMYRVDDIWMQKTINYIFLRSVASVLVPIGIIIDYRLKEVKSSVLKATSDFWNGRES